MQSLATGPSNLPGGYHRDLQLTKGAVMRSLQITSDVLSALHEVVKGVEFKPESTEAACTPELLATYRALRRMDRGVPFRTAYRAAADSEATDPVRPDSVLGTYATAGGPGQEAPDRVRERLEGHTHWLDEKGGA
jgi:argininosuccinate lyase